MVSRDRRMLKRYLRKRRKEMFERRLEEMDR